MFCNKRKIMYLHPPRNGGKSIEDIIFNEKPALGSSCHKTITDFIHKGVDINSYYKFMFCRNPWDRLVSIYYWWITISPVSLDESEENTAISESFNKWVSGEFLKKDMYDGHKIPQIKWITDEENDKIIKLDYLGRFENFEKDFNKLCENLDMDLKLPHHNATRHDHYSVYYNEESIEIVTKIFREDIEYFSYKFEEKV